jgi:hypothetical protein
MLPVPCASWVARKSRFVGTNVVIAYRSRPIQWKNLQSRIMIGELAENSDKFQVNPLAVEILLSKIFLARRGSALGKMDCFRVILFPLEP